MRERLDRRTDRTAVDDRISRIGDVRRRLRGDIKLGIAADEGEGTTGESDSDASRQARRRENRIRRTDAAQPRDHGLLRGHDVNDALFIIPRHSTDMAAKLRTRARVEGGLFLAVG